MARLMRRGDETREMTALFKKMSIFSKMMVLIVLLLISVLLLYGRSNFISVKVVEHTLKDANEEQLQFFVKQLDATLQQLATFTVTLKDDPDIMKFHSKFIESSYMNIDVIFQKEKIMQKLIIQSLSAAWVNELSVFSPSIKEVISTNSNRHYNDAALRLQMKRGWQAQKSDADDEEGFSFSYYTIEPYAMIDQLDQAKRLIEVRFQAREIGKALDEFKASGSRDPFMYHSDYGIIANSTARSEQTAEVIGHLQEQSLGSSGSLEVDLQGKPYIVTYVRSGQLGWYVADYIAVDDILAPINESRNYFYLSIAILIILSIFAAYMLYRHVQRPVRELTLGVRTIERGNYSARMAENHSADFKFLFNSFNRMAERIENLIQSVLSERIRTREAELKQLQTQINPHFLFNCFALIMSMARSNKKEAILSITHSLSKYYRYTTRSEVMLCKLKDELEFIRHYLSIHKMRMPRLHYDIRVEEAVLELVIPKLLIQPLVENAVIHGIESKLSASTVILTAMETAQGCQIIVADDGGCMTKAEINELMRKINGPLLEEMGCGLWNVNQRVKMLFGEDSRLSYELTADGWTRAILHINTPVRRDGHV